MIKRCNPTDDHEQVHQLLLTYNKDGAESSFVLIHSGKETGADVIEYAAKDADYLTHIQSEYFFLDVANPVNDKHVIFDETNSVSRFKRPRTLIFFDNNKAVDELNIEEASKYLCEIGILKHSKNGRMN